MRQISLALSAAAAALAVAPAARADVTAKSEAGFVSRNAVEVAATPEAAWAVLTTPSGWWNGDHTFSGDAKNLTLNPVAGGCFCEKLPPPAGSPPRTAMGGVEHMRVVNAQPGRVLRLTGALGPLQSEAVSGVLTITLKPGETGTRILFEYVVGGYMRYKTDDIAPAVDTVMKDQLAGLALKIDPALAAKVAPAPPAAPTPATPARATAAATAAKPGAATSSGVKPARPAAPAATPPARDPDADKARGDEAAAAMAAMTTPATAPAAATAKAARPVPAAPAAPAAAATGAAAYVTRSFIVRRPAAGSFVLADEADPQAVVPVLFATAAVADRFGQGWTAGASAANRTKTVVCSCTGQFTTIAGKRVFSVIDAVFSYK